jgi:GNAT superfamily N-acetyltransferase
MKPWALPYKLRQAVRFRGPFGAARWTLRRVANRIVCEERHVWYVLEPGGDRPKLGLPAGLVLRRCGESDLPLLRELDTVSPEEGRERLRGGHDLWLVLEGDHPVSACWTFRGRTPALAAPGGWLPLPPGVACQEDSVTAPPARGRGIGPAAWSTICDALAAEGQHYLVRKVEVQNAPARRAGEKAGFKPVAVMRFRRIGPIARTSVQVLNGEVGGLLAERLDSRRPPRGSCG